MKGSGWRVGAQRRGYEAPSPSISRLGPRDFVGRREPARPGRATRRTSGVRVRSDIPRRSPPLDDRERDSAERHTRAMQRKWAHAVVFARFSNATVTARIVPRRAAEGGAHLTSTPPSRRRPTRRWATRTARDQDRGDHGPEGVTDVVTLRASTSNLDGRAVVVGCSRRPTARCAQTGQRVDRERRARRRRRTYRTSVVEKCLSVGGRHRRGLRYYPPAYGGMPSTRVATSGSRPLTACPRGRSRYGAVHGRTLHPARRSGRHPSAI